MTSQQVKLGLDEASILINRTAASSLTGESIQVLYQLGECYGCPLDKLKSIESNDADQTIVLDTKHSIDLELRRTGSQQQHLNAESSQLVCNFAKLSLQSHARYRIDISQVATVSANQTAGYGKGFNCSLQTIDEGECSYCPLALLFFVLLLVTALERLYTSFVGRRRNGQATRHLQRPRLSSTKTTTVLAHPDDRQPKQQQRPPPAGGVEDQAMAAPTDQLSADEGLPVSLDNRPHDEPASASPHTESNNLDDQDGLSMNNNNDSSENPSAKSDGSTKVGGRIGSLDAFRGLTIAGMIVVNYGGAGYRMLEHQPWDGLTLADLVFPFFIFSMGASIALSIKSQVKRGRRMQEIFLKIFRRAALLMALGLCLNSKWLDIHSQGLDELRLTGVLQRFSISYLVVASMYATKLSVIKWIKAQSLYRVPMVSRLVGVIFEYLTALNYLAVYVYVSFFFHYSDSCPAGYLGPGGWTENGIYANCTGGAAAWLDLTVLGSRHLYGDHELMRVFKTKRSHDPEGLLGNTTSILLTLIGLQCGKILLAKPKPPSSPLSSSGSRTGSSTTGGNAIKQVHRTRLQSFLKWQIVLALLSLTALFIPINKRLWSLPFVSVTALLAFALMTILYTALDIYQCQRTFLLRLLISAGKNPILLYVGHSLLAGMLPWQFYVDESSHLQLLLRLTWSTLCWLLIAHYMASKRLFIRL